MQESDLIRFVLHTNIVSMEDGNTIIRPSQPIVTETKACINTTNHTTCTHSDEERAILGTCCHVELLKAIEKGYRILRLDEVWHFPEQSDELFKEYVDTFLKIKQEASGYPNDCTTPEQKQTYVAEYFEHEGIAMDSQTHAKLVLG